MCQIRAHHCYYCPPYNASFLDKLRAWGYDLILRDGEREGGLSVQGLSGGEDESRSSFFGRYLGRAKRGRRPAWLWTSPHGASPL